MDISIVSGTYNRIASLQKMVASIRNGFSDFDGLHYEIILVDGGSEDGTLDWCRSQDDINLIEHGQLLGAVKAFNDGAFQAIGQYVVLANDDIEFVGDSIWRAYVYMQTHKDCGIGCFYQDRNGRDWHVEEMPCVEDSQQVHRPYGQVCIVPKWLGDFVGWWGNYLHTYGGDNELSARVYNLGFKVSPVPGSRIHDNEIQDDLRKINNIQGGKDPRAVRGHHPDSWAWGKRWRDKSTGLVGPIIKAAPTMDNPTQIKERIVYLPIYEQGWPVQKEQKRGLREALAKIGTVAEFDYVSYNQPTHMFGDLQALMERVQPTLFLSQIHNGEQISGAAIRELRKNYPDTKFVNWNGDFWPEQLLNELGIELAKAFDLQLIINRDVLDKYLVLGVNSDYWQIGYEPDGIGHQAGETHDVVFLASGYSKARQQFAKQLRSLSGISIGLYGQGWPEGWAKGQNLYNFKEACSVYRGAKISIGDSQWPESGFVSNRVFQALAAGGAVLAHQYFRDMDQLGLVDGQTCIIWKDFKELEQKIRYYLAREDERRRVAEAGEQLALEHHSFDNRVQELFMMLQREAAVEADWRW